MRACACVGVWYITADVKVEQFTAEGCEVIKFFMFVLTACNGQTAKINDDWGCLTILIYDSEGQVCQVIIRFEPFSNIDCS